MVMRISYAVVFELARAKHKISEDQLKNLLQEQKTTHKSLQD